MAHDETKAPFPWFGGKSRAAGTVWSALGDVNSYVEPFAGSLAVLLNRPHVANRPYHSETVNDMDGLLVNAWRAIQLSPEATAEACSWPVTEADKHARHCALVRWRQETQLEHLMGDPAWHDPVTAGWWLYGIGTWIGGGWCSGRGPWWPDETGRLVRRRGGGEGEGVKRERPHLSNDGHGVHAPQLREEGVSRQLPHLSDNGNGVHTAAMREEGTGEPHPMVMPKLLHWFRCLSARLRHVRIVNGDWRRVCGPSVVETLGSSACGVFLDPPYIAADRAAGLYAVDSGTVAEDVREWALYEARPTWRVIIAGFEGAYAEPLLSAGWREIEWFRGGLLTGGYANRGEGTKQHRERLWLSPSCL